MGFCSRRYIFLSVCLLQLLIVIERQVFDFLGFLWIPILVNFFEIIFIILGFFGAYQYRPKYVISYILWHLFWLGWNAFIICLYLNVGELDHKTNVVLKLDPKSESWWSNEGPGCEKIVPPTSDPLKVTVKNCLVDYVYVEVVQSSLQCAAAVIGFIVSICLTRSYLEEDDTFNYEDAKGPEHLFLHPMYVSSSDNLNKHLSKSNPHLSVKLAPLNARKQGGKFVKNKISGDAVRFITKSSSFDTLNIPKKRTVRPKSLYSSPYLKNNSDLSY